MPGSQGYTSQAQRGFMHAKHPEIAKRMDKETPKGKKLPYHAQSRRAALERAAKK